MREVGAWRCDGSVGATRRFWMKIKIMLRHRVPTLTNKRRGMTAAFQHFRICTVRGARPTPVLPFISCRFRIGPNLGPGEKTRRDKKQACTVYWRHGPRLSAPALAFIEHRACNSTGAPTAATDATVISPSLPPPSRSSLLDLLDASSSSKRVPPPHLFQCIRREKADILRRGRIEAENLPVRSWNALILFRGDFSSTLSACSVVIFYLLLKRWIRNFPFYDDFLTAF